MLEHSQNLFARAGRSGLLCLAILLSFAVPPAFAVEVPTLYSAEVPYDATARNPRTSAYAAALAAVLARVSSTELSSNRLLIDELFPNPDAYVMQFRQDTEDSMWVSFDGEAVESVLRRSGQPVWGSDRPLTLVWLAVDWGQGSREIIGADGQDPTRAEARSIDRNRMLRERILEIAENRGLPLAFPLLDTTDLQSVAFSDIWGGFDERVIDASERYDANSVLIGRVRAASSQQNRWTYAFGGERRAWTGPAESVVGQIADLLASELAVGGDTALRRLDLRVSGVESVDAYGSMQRILASVPVIEHFTIVEVVGDAIHYSVEVRGDAERLQRALRFAGLIEQEDGNVFTNANARPTLEFFYNP